jgi:predicted restriction endonuclease
MKELEEYHFLHNQLKWAKCEECGNNIKLDTRTNNAHILPKHQFKSVSTNIHNHLYLCFFCHNKYDKSWEDAQSMSVFSLAKKRFKKFENEIEENNRQELQFFN